MVEYVHPHISIPNSIKHMFFYSKNTRFLFLVDEETNTIDETMERSFAKGGAFNLFRKSFSP